MSGRAARARALLLAAAFAAAACQRPEPSTDAGAPPPAPPPDAERSICERPARDAGPAADADAEAEASFQAFAEEWLEKKRAPSLPGTRREIGGGFETELRATGDARAPWVGTLRYCEHVLTCAAEAAADRCTSARRNAITEIFRFEGGEWRY